MESDPSVNVRRSLIFTVIILLLNSGVLRSQELPTGIKVGVQIGLSYSGLRTSQPDESMIDYEYYGSIASYNLNAYLKYQFSKRLGISIEPGFILKGADMKNSSSEFRFSYVTMPIMINFSLSKPLSIGAGIELDYLTKATLHNNLYNSLDYAKYCEELDLGLIIGVDCSPIKLMDVAFRYSYGIFPVMEIQGVDKTGNGIGEIKSFNNLIQLSLRFNIIKFK